MTERAGDVVIRKGVNAVSLMVDIMYEEGGDQLLAECYTLTSDSCVWAVGDELIQLGKRLQKMSDAAEEWRAAPPEVEPNPDAGTQETLAL